MLPWSMPEDFAETLTRTDWQMAPGERAAITGLLALARPEVAIELGAAQGGSLRQIAARSGHVHSFDLAPAVVDPPDNVTLHAGDSHVLLPQVLSELHESETAVGFALVDGDHSPAGVRQDLEDLIDAAAVRRAYIVVHDTMNEGILAGLRAIDFARRAKISSVDLAFVQLRQSATGIAERWGGLGLVVVDDRTYRDVRSATMRTVAGVPAGREAVWQAFAPARSIARRVRYRRSGRA